MQKIGDQMLRPNIPPKAMGVEGRDKWLEWVQVCTDYDYVLTARELDFIESITEQLRLDKNLSEKQEDWLKQIAARVADWSGSRR
jgi:hypothetical protein